MSAAEVNRLESGYPDEAADCAIVSLAIYLGVAYTDVLRATTVLDRKQGRDGLYRKTIQRVSAELGHPLKWRKRFDPDEDYGVICSADHAAVLRGGLVLDRIMVWPVEAWLKAQGARLADCVLLVAAE